MRYNKFAHKIATRSNHPVHHLAAVVLRGGAIVSYATNMGRWGHCAERRAIRPHTNYAGTMLIVVRSNGGCSKPCKRCAKLIKEAGIKRVGYVNEDRQFVVEKV